MVGILSVRRRVAFRPARDVFILEKLEPRLLLSADPVSGGTEVFLFDRPDEPADVAPILEEAPSPTVQNALATGDAGGDGTDSNAPITIDLQTADPLAVQSLPIPQTGEAGTGDVSVTLHDETHAPPGFRSA